MNTVMSMSPALASARATNPTRVPTPEPLLRTLIGDALRSERLGQSRTLRNVSQAARVSLGYLSEIERGQKEASSELLAAICSALEIRVADVLLRVLDAVAPVPVVTRPAGVESLPVRQSDRGAAPVVNRAA